MDIEIREETRADIGPIWSVNKPAFGRVDEAALVDRLRQAGKISVSLVAWIDVYAVGHILFTPVQIEQCPVPAVGLGPMAVLPNFQGRGFGGRLIKAGLKRCRERGYGLVVVVGHPDYYPKFGFVPASEYGLRCEFDPPPEAFMVRELIPGVLQQTSGLVKYTEEFSEVV